MAFGTKRTKLNSLHYFERKALFHQFFCHHVKDAQSIDKFCWVSKWHRTNNGRTIIFWTGVGGLENFNMQTFFFHKRLAAANNFLCVSVFLQTLFFNRCNLFQCLQPLQTIYFKIFQPSPPPPPNRPRQKIMVRPSWQRRKKIIVPNKTRKNKCHLIWLSTA